MSKLPRIYVGIASFRDPQCQWTVKDMFEKATHPERITVGICWQYDPDTDQECFEVEPPFPKQVKTKHYHYTESRGGCWARAKSLSFLDDEDYVLQIDAHMRFVPGWDELMIAALKRCATPKAILTGHPPGYTPPDTLEEAEKARTISVNKLGGPDEMQLIHMGRIERYYKDIPKEPFLTAFFIGNFLFSPAAVYKEVPYDPYIYFRGQESVYSARLWTHGWDIYQSERVLIYHYWQSKPLGGDEVNHKRANDAALLGRQRVRHLLQMGLATNKKALVEIDKYGMGSVRSLNEFWEFAGVNLVTGVVQPKAKQGLWKPYEPPIALRAKMRFHHPMDMERGTQMTDLAPAKKSKSEE